MSFDVKGACFKPLVAFCRQVAKIQQTTDLISFVASEKEYIRFCRKITDLDDKFQKQFNVMCQANRICPDDIRRKMRPVASVLGICKRADYYNILGVSPDADEQTIKQAYRKKARILHPDKAGKDAENSDAFIKLHDAYMNLSDSMVRQPSNQPRDGTDDWVENKKILKMSAWGPGFGRFMSWMFVLIGSVIIVFYAFDIYKNGSMTFLQEQLRTHKSNQPELISKKQFGKESRAKTMEIVTIKKLHSNSDSAYETEYETEAAHESKVKLNSKKQADAAVASWAKAKSAAFSQQDRTKSDRAIAYAVKRRSIKKDVFAEAKLRQKQNAQRVQHVGESTSKKRLDRVLNKTSLESAANKKVAKRIDTNEVNYVQEQQRLLTFLKKYTSAYEQKDLSLFCTFFVQDAVEQGKPFDAMLPTYQQTFNKVEALRYQINIRSFTIDYNTKKIMVEGAYTANYRLPEKDWGNSSGTIRMELLDLAGGLMVSKLEYDKGSR
jgi:curved DNA-binding protein CbpA